MRGSSPQSLGKSKYLPSHESLKSHVTKLTFSEKKLILRTHDWDGNTTRETTVDVASIDGQLVVNDSCVALCVDDEPKERWCIGRCRTLSQIAIWNLESGDVTRIVVPQDERAPQCVS